jgi:hypothetical protein
MHRVLAFMVVVVLLSAWPAAAQDAGNPPAPNRPQGWWGSVGVDFSAMRFACQDCADEQPVYESAAGQFAFGKSIGTKVAFGAEVATAAPKGPPGRAVITAVTGIARWYPSSSPLYVKFGVGLARGRNSLVSGAGLYQTIRNGVAISFGAGYDIKVGRSVAVTPMAGWYMSAIGDVITPTAVIRNVSWNNWTFGVSLTIF